jgi:hypothetical protein
MVKWFAAVFGVAFGLSAGVTTGVLVSAAPGDVIYVYDAPRVEITAAQAKAAAKWAIDSKAWDGDISDVTRIEIERDAGRFTVQVQGLKSSRVADIKDSVSGMRVVGIKK